MFEETPLFTLLRIFFMQAVGMQAYFAYNALGNKELYPGYTNVIILSSDAMILPWTDDSVPNDIALLATFSALQERAVLADCRFRYWTWHYGRHCMVLGLPY